jgi:putative FmdB family regulatory protein
MPIYEYQCAACGRVVEKWQKMSEAPLSTCAACGGGLSKLISSCSFHLKGSGWYVTDYGGSHSATAPSDSSEGAKAAAASPEPAKAKETKETKEAKAVEKTETSAPPKKFK